MNFFDDGLSRFADLGVVYLRRMGPMTPDHLPPPCPACKVAFKAGDYCTLIALGPGDDDEGRRRAREGRVYNAVALPVHWACATGEPDPVPGARSDDTKSAGGSSEPEGGR